jgi:hypothetical protein
MFRLNGPEMPKIDLNRALRPRFDSSEREQMLNWTGRGNEPRPATPARPEAPVQTINRGPVFGRRGRDHHGR